MKNQLLIGLTAYLAVSTAQAVTLQVSSFFPGTQTVLGDENGSGVNGVTWGILVDTNNDGFGGFTTTAAAGGETLSDGFFGSSDDYLYLSSNLTATFGGLDGSATQIIYNLTSDTASKDYALVWFTDAAAGSTLDSGYVGLQAVTDPTPPFASNGNSDSLTEFHGQTLTASIEVIPEPSSALLVSLAGGLALLRRRR